MKANHSTAAVAPTLAFALLDHIAHPLCCLSKDLDCFYANKAWSAYFALPTHCNIGDEDVHVKSFPAQQPCSKPSLTILRDYAQKAFQDGECLFSFVFLNSSGKEILADVILSSVEYTKKTCLLMQCFPQQVSIHSLLNEADKTNDQSWIHAILDLPLTNSTLWNDAFELIDCSKYRYDAFNVSKSVFMENFFSFCSEFQEGGVPSPIAVKQYLQEALEQGFSSHNWTYVKADGTHFTNKILFVRVSVQQKNYVICFNLENMSSRQFFTETLMENYNHMKLLLKHLPIGVDLWNKNYELYDCSDAALHYFGVESKEEYLTSFMDFSPEFQPNGERSSDAIARNLQLAYEKGQHDFEWLYISKSGEELPTAINIVTSKNEFNENVAIVYYTDLREIKRKLNRVKKEEQRLSYILNSAPYAITTWNSDFIPIDCNARTLEIFGFETKDEFVQDFVRIMPQRQKDGRITQDVFQQVFKEAFTEGHAFTQGELINVKTNAHFSVELSLKKITLNGIDRIILYLTDLSLKNKMLQEILESHAALSEARDVAERNSKIKSEFLANMSHEIRTPMNGILGLIHLMLFTELNYQQKSYADKILLSAEGLLRIINDILDFSKIEAGKLEMEKVPFTLLELKEELSTLFAPKFEEKNIHGEIFSEQTLDTRLLGDSLRLKQVFLNLIGNAIKFTDKGSITVSIDQVAIENDSNVTYTFTVKDTGIGLTQEQCSRLFTAFSQADTSITRKYGGTGLGLIIAKRIIEMMHGNIWVKSEYGKGSAFCFNVTLELDSSVHQTFAEVDLSEIQHNPNAKLGHILLVEDNEINQLIALELITARGHSVDVAQNGQEAIEMLENKKYDMVFMDIQMPVMDGLTATKKIRKLPKLMDLPIIAMSAHAMKGDKEISLNHGMNDHLTKPIQPKSLYSCIDSWITY